MSEHSPGPWKAVSGWEFNDNRDEHGDPVKFAVTTADHKTLARSLSEADAGLIAAAPEMLAMLRWLADMAGAGPMHPRVSEVRALLDRIDGKG